NYASLWTILCLAFFFSSRRRHTRSKRDWSSDVCSSDLAMRRSGEALASSSAGASASPERRIAPPGAAAGVEHLGSRAASRRLERSEERRVGKERTNRCARGD